MGGCGMLLHGRQSIARRPPAGRLTSGRGHRRPKSLSAPRRRPVASAGCRRAMAAGGYRQPGSSRAPRPSIRRTSRPAAAEADLARHGLKGCSTSAQALSPGRVPRGCCTPPARHARRCAFRAARAPGAVDARNPRPRSGCSWGRRRSADVPGHASICLHLRLHSLPGIQLHDRRMLPREDLILVHDLSDADRARQDPVQMPDQVGSPSVKAC